MSIAQMVIAMKKNGFTLFELIVTLAIAAVVMTVGVPSLRTVINNNRRVSSVNDFIAALYSTRSEAIKRNIRVTLCKSADQTNCSTSATYNQGWIIFEDKSTIWSIDTGDTIIKVFEGFPSNIALTSTGDVANFVSYLPSGRVDNNGTICANGCSFTVTVASESKTIDLSRTGRVKAAN